MIAATLAWSSRHRRLVVAGAAVAALAGEVARQAVRRDLIPDLSYPQIAVSAEWTGHAAVDVARSVTAVLTGACEGVAGVTTVRGASMTGMAYVDVVFGRASALAAGRTSIVERLAQASARLPPDVRVRVGPETSSVG